MGVMSSDELGKGLASTIWSSLLTLVISEAVGVDGLSIHGIGLNETEMSRCTNKPRSADTRFSIKGQQIVGEVNLYGVPASCE
jgi:hypothetical protein